MSKRERGGGGESKAYPSPESAVSFWRCFYLLEASACLEHIESRLDEPLHSRTSLGSHHISSNLKAGCARSGGTGTQCSRFHEAGFLRMKEKPEASLPPPDEDLACHSCSLLLPL